MTTEAPAFPRLLCKWNAKSLPSVAQAVSMPAALPLCSCVPLPQSRHWGSLPAPVLSHPVLRAPSDLLPGISQGTPHSADLQGPPWPTGESPGCLGNHPGPPRSPPFPLLWSTLSSWTQQSSLGLVGRLLRLGGPGHCRGRWDSESSCRSGAAESESENAPSVSMEGTGGFSLCRGWWFFFFW